MRILVVQLGFIGDCILSTPLPEAIATLHPKAEIWVLTTPLSKVVYQRNPFVKGVLTFDKRKQERGLRGIFAKAKELRQFSFQRVYSLHRSGRTSLMLALAQIPERVGFSSARMSWLYTSRRPRFVGEHDVFRNLSILGSYKTVQQLPARPRIIPPQNHEVSEGVQKLLSDTSPYVTVFPGSVWKTKRWDPEGFRSVVQSLCEKGIKVLILGAPNEKEDNAFVAHGTKAIDLTGETSLAETFALVSHSSLMCCNDSMALHLASSFNLPSVTVFCATSPFFGFGPFKNGGVVVQHENLPCKPCRRHGSNICPVGTEACSKEVEAQRVLSEIDTLLRASFLSRQELGRADQ
jgi:heptosyltransferase II